VITPFERFAGDLERHYGIQPNELVAAPRGFAAETYFVETANQSYFLKIMNNPRRQNSFKHGLQVTDALIRHGIPYIPSLFKTGSGQLWFDNGQAVAALFTRIDAKHTYNYNREDVFRKLAHIYQVTKQIAEHEVFLKETFNDQFIEAYEQERSTFMNNHLATKEAAAIKGILEPYAEFLASCGERAASIVTACRAHRSPFYLTHSDYTNNVMVSDSGEHYLIDFDEALLGPIERDGFLCMASQNEESRLWLHIMQETFPDYEPIAEYILYYLFERFMIDLTTFMQESRHHPDEEHRRRLVGSTKEYLLGWLYPMIEKNATFQSRMVL
jgi:Ser/Thr protein kinase RdoA (MazF antagonist)